MKRTFIDSCVFINHLFKGEKPSGKVAKQFLKRLENGEFEGVTSPFVLLEVHTVGRTILVRHTMKKEREIERDVLNGLVQIGRISNLIVYPTQSQSLETNEVIKTAPPLVRKYFGRITSCKKTHRTPLGRDRDGFYAIDPIHLATAMLSDCDEIATFDRDFEDVDEPNITVRILKP